MKSYEKLEKFLQEEYLDNPNMGSPDVPTAIRDMITDLLHIANKFDTNVRHKLMDAEEVYEIECEEA
jgi:hypothetical protein